MATVLLPGPRTWSLTRDDQGYREYKIEFLVKGNTSDGPATALQTPGLPLPGAAWFVGTDIDIWVWCRPEASVKIHDEKKGDPNKWWEVTITFSNKPFKRCMDIPIGDPLLEPMKLSGSFIKEKEEAVVDMYGRAITTSSWERISGPQVEFDSNRPQIKIEQNVAILDLPTCIAMQDTVNQFPLWGLPPRYIKLSHFTWSKNYYGQCHVYYRREFEFEVNYKTFDRLLLDEGTKVLNGHWDPDTGLWELDFVDDDGTPPDPNNPSHFIQFVDRAGNPIKAVLDGQGKPYVPIDDVDDPFNSEYEDGGFGSLQTIQPPALNSAGVLPPSGFVISNQPGGQLPVGVVFKYKVTARTLSGETTAATPITAAATDSTNRTILVSWTPVPGATSYRIYRNGPTETAGVGPFDFVLYDEVIVPDISRPGHIFVQKYYESDFLLLGIPVAL